MHTIFFFYGGWIFLMYLSIQLGILPFENIAMPIFKKGENYLTLTVYKTLEHS